MDINFNINEDHNKLLASQLRKKLILVKKGGGEARISKLHAAGKMTARERIDFIFDEPEKALEIYGGIMEQLYLTNLKRPWKLARLQVMACILIMADALQEGLLLKSVLLKTSNVS